jgi:alkanesulfonate monooxygenase SsuD/methylene tetrahydromethanopterin reductase-like flavin-dependent oxidoreductase (luciferase family)
MRFGLFVMGTQSGTYQDILDQVCYAEKLGFHVVLLAERHFCHGNLLYPSPFSMAGAIAARTEQIRIATAARILPLHHPLRIAEEAATLDILSDGRLDFGATRASLDEGCHAVFHSPLSESRGRFEEALEVIIQAWTQTRLSYRGQYYQFVGVSGLPRPLQAPHPPIYLVAVSLETIAFAAQKGYSAFMPGTHTLAELREKSTVYWRTVQEAGHSRRPLGLGVNRFVYVSRSDAQARREIRGPFLHFISERAPDLKAALLRKYGCEARLCYDRFVEDFCLFGSPASVGSRIKELEAEAGLVYLLCSLNFITLEHDLCVRSMERFAREVMPQFTASPRERCLQGAPV